MASKTSKFIKKPKYGYARDRFGRVQERDNYREDQWENPYSSSNSLYDSEDDHDSVYENGFD